MKTIKTIAVSLLVVPFFAFAQAQPAELPSAGLTPESTFYFLDKFAESLREFFTVNPEGKARLQITFAKERIAEIKVIMEEKGVDAKGLETAQTRLQDNLSRANSILAERKASGEDVSALAKELDDDFDGPKSALKETFKAEKRVLEAKEKDLKAKIREAKLAGDAIQADALIKELGDVKAQKEQLEIKSDEQEEALEQEESQLEEAMEDKTDAEKAINEAGKKKQEILDEAAKDGISISAEEFAKFDQLLSQAKELFARENYQGAKQLAKQAKKSLEDVKDAAENIKDENEQKEESEKDRVEQIREDAKDSAESVREEQKRAGEEVKKAEEETKQAEEQKRDSSNEGEDR